MRQDGAIYIPLRIFICLLSSLNETSYQTGNEDEQLDYTLITQFWT